ncbi:MAG: hypothetical protein Nkreftii_001051 [Candidatus Nitrospira kreftii]|uniref:Uncharacterized protein n=1 Tax=Candidatus Nitrospira kreftii TaxID=2652173 RepID=A0A7S8FCI9_9BACT|nr:MAG: hypothetical protein Nkreftii_001051 [Candidatus Nitrospira kreftii]
MLHRMALRVLPSLSLAVTEDSVRRKKRIVMFLPGLIAFGVYRLAKHFLPITDPLVLLAVSSVVAMVTALLAYRVGRAAPWTSIVRQDGWHLLGWLVGWIGAAYGIQLSLLVLTLLWIMHYSYLQHPDGPAMMAIIISCTSVARDAFEIGHVRKLSALGRPFLTFPDGEQLRLLVQCRSRPLGLWAVAGLGIGAIASLCGVAAVDEHNAALAQLLGVTILGGGVALCAYLGGLNPSIPWRHTFRQTTPAELLKYWWWPGMAFASTYYLVAMGVVLFVAKQPLIAPEVAAAMGALVAAMMGVYGYYLGHRRDVENEEVPQLSSGMLRCPFVMGILGRQVSSPQSVEAELAFQKNGIKG